MLTFLSELIVHKGNVFFLLYVVGGLLMTVTAGSQCVDVAVQMAQNPVELLHLSNILFRLLGLRRQIGFTNIQAKRQLKRRLYFNDSFKSLLDVGLMRLIPGSPEKQMNLEPTCANCVFPRRCKIYYILICGVRGRPLLTLCLGNSGSKLRSYDPSNQLQWLVSFNRRVQERGDAIVLLVGPSSELLVGGHTGQISTKLKTKDALNEHCPSHLTVGLSVLSVLLLWMFLSPIALCAILLLSWKVRGSAL